MKRGVPLCTWLRKQCSIWKCGRHPKYLCEPVWEGHHLGISTPLCREQVDRGGDDWDRSVYVQCRTAKIDKFASAQSGFFQGKWTPELILWSGGLKTSKNTLLETFPRFLPLDDFFFKFFNIMPYQISKLVVTFITQIITCCHNVRFKLRQQCRNGTCGKYRLRGVF